MGTRRKHSTAKIEKNGAWNEAEMVKKKEQWPGRGESRNKRVRGNRKWNYSGRVEEGGKEALGSHLLSWTNMYISIFWMHANNW